MNSSVTFLSHSEAETDQLGSALAGVLSCGLTIAIDGQLGSGKTRFVRALCESLGIDTTKVNSPTFVILQLYTDGRIPVAHMDTYRLADIDEFLAIGADEYLDSNDWLALIEWADRIAAVLPADRLTVTIRQSGETQREFVFKAGGLRSESVLATLRQKPLLTSRVT
jgi:tRNA threonylcarbamoyladenosine biosynthesis protein TsaE